MEQEKKATIRNYAICFGVEALIAFLVIWAKGFFAHSASENIQILSDAFFVAGIVMVLYAGLMYVSGEGFLVTVQYIFRHVILTFIPMGRAKHERYLDYRERKLSGVKKRNKSCLIVSGLTFLFIGIIFTVIWYKTYYNVA